MSGLANNNVRNHTDRGFVFPAKPFVGQKHPLVLPVIGCLLPLVGSSCSASRKSRSAAAPNGFTLFELIIGLVLVTILLSISIPSMRDIVQRNRVVTATNQFVALINVARSEALRTGRTVAICRSADPEAAAPACNATNFTGWLVYRYGDTGTAARAYDSSVDTAANGGGIVRVMAFPISRSGGVISSSSVIISANTSNTAIIAFDTIGGVNADGAQDYAVCNYGALGDSGKGRIVTISAIGRVSVRPTDKDNGAEASCFTST